MNKPVLLSVDDDPSVLTAVQQDLRTEYGEEYRVLGADSGPGGLGLVEELRKRGDPGVRRAPLLVHVILTENS